MEKAKAARFKHWFNKGMQLTDGKIKYGSPVTWANTMRNMFREYGWDAPTDEKPIDKEYTDQVGGLMKLLSNVQNKV
jgi:hypothetical protein